MNCQACQHENPAGNAFCGGCGSVLVARCPKCGESNPPANGFCGKCGHRLAPVDAEEKAAEPEIGERRQVTVMFCDLVGSTDLSARLDPEDYREALRTYHAKADAVIARYGSQVAQHLGDGLLIYFGWPQTYDDAAERAVRAGLELVEVTATVQAGGAPLAARVGLHTGAVVVSDVGVGARRETLALGDTPNVAARVQSTAQPGQVLISAATHRLVAGLFIVEELGAHSLKGVPQPVELYHVVQPSGVRGRLAAAHGFTAFVNRTEERAILRSRFELVCEGEGQVVLLTGEAGIGKSRLAQMLREELADTAYTWLETGGSARFANTPFYPVTELLRQRRPWDDESPAVRTEGVVRSLRHAGVDPSEALPLVAPLLDLPLPEGYRPMGAAPEVVRKRLLATLAAWLVGTARLQPLVVLIEDLHWVDPSSLELLQILLDQGVTVQLLLLLTARPQFQIPWRQRGHYTQLTLSPLSKRHVRDMVLGVAAQTTLLAEVIDAVAARTDGVPLFVEELTKAVVEVGAAAAKREIPSTLADSLMARLDRLGPQAREVAQVGAVCGKEFSFGLMQAVHPIAEAELEAALRKLVDADLLRVRGLAPDASYSFKHALVQDSAYESLLRSRRRALHGQIAAALSQKFPAVADAQPEVLAQHHTEAEEIEPALAAWQRAGERAADRGADREAERYVRRALELVARLPEGSDRDFQEFHLSLALGRALNATKGLGAPEVAATFDHAREVGERIAGPEQLVVLLCFRVTTALAREGPAAARLLIDQFAPTAQRTQQPWIQALVRGSKGIALYHAGEFAAAIACLEEGLAVEYDSNGLPTPLDPPMVLHYHLAVANWQIGLIDRARVHLNHALARAEQSSRPTDRAWGAHQAAAFSVLLRDPAAAQAYAEHALDVGGEGASPMDAAVARIIRGWAIAELGQPDIGLGLMGEGLNALGAIGQRLGQEFYHCLLADAHARAGNVDEALRVLADGEDACPSQLSSRSATLLRRAELLRRRGTPVGEVEAAYENALTMARRLTARSLELRAATEYARWLREHERGVEAFELLAPVYAGFTEGFDTRDLREASELLEALNVSKRESDSSLFPARDAI